MKLPGRANTARRTRALLTAVAAALFVGIFTPLQPASAVAYVTISGAGSTWSENAIVNWITNVISQGITVNYNPVGSASGRQEFAAGTVDWGASDIPYGVQDGTNSNPLPSRGFTYVPDTAGGVAFMYNLHIGGQQVTNLRLSGAVVAGIFTNQITTWNDPRIAADNPGLTLPAEPIVPVVRTDSSGSTYAFTQWLVGTQSSAWTAYCTAVGLSPCTQTTGYPVESGTAMVGESGDLGVTGYVTQAASEGAIGYTEYSYALETGFPVAKVLNAAGYYAAPTPHNIGVSLLQAQVNTDTTSPLYQTENLSGVYSDTDPRTYELSYYSYLIVPTDLTGGSTTAKGLTLGAFGQYLLCQGQQVLDTLGYAALPVNLVEDGFTQLLKIPGNAVPSSIAADLQRCSNPTMSDGSDILVGTAPMPPACDQQGTTQCATSSSTATTTKLTASPDPAIIGQPVTLTATESAADGTTPAGTVQFEVGSTDIGAPVVVNASGVATTTTTVASSGAIELAAVFTPTSTSYATSTGMLPMIVPPLAIAAGAMLVDVAVTPMGSLTVTVPTVPAELIVQDTTAPLTATAMMNTVSLTETRNTVPGWSVSGQDTAFTGSGTAAGSTFSGDLLGWAPGGAVSGGATLGPVVPPGASPGLQDAAQVLASAAPGSGMGTDSVGAVLTLDIPTTASVGPYTSTLTITYLLTGP